MAGRFWFGSLRHGFDYDSWRIVTDLCEQGKNVYASTIRYNYGPVWFNILHLLDLLSGHNPAVFRQLLIGFLSAADLGIAFLLWRRFGPLAGALFFLNPVSMMASSIFNQFDNVAILLGLWAVVVFGDEFEKPLDRRKYAALAILGLSLMTKHVLFVFPFWLAVKQRGLVAKFLIMAIPTVIFLASFAPYWPAGHAGIVANVFEYRALNDTLGRWYNQFFYNEILPEILRSMAGAQFWWFVLLVWFAFFCRAKSGFDSLLIYTGVMVAFSPSLFCYYFAIPMALACARMNLFSLCFMGFAALHIAVYGTEPKLITGIPGRFDDIAIYFLIATLVWVVWRGPILQALQNCRREINRQFANGD
ncbi:MAG TPA: hypothetical protein VG347_18385 [Verrucomicrobiae bacterium]|nr:hypothetical protein [Verrucomicrobiae bacterium]